MKKIPTSAFAAVLLLAMLAVVQHLAVPGRAAEVSCSGVINDLSLCLDFLQGDAGQPSARCCDGVKAIYAAADTTAARQATCECLKSAYNMVNADLYAMQTLPGACGVPLSYTISPDIDCSQ
ncbi:non-specific lipid-transfer protein 1-like [Panicum miliaceum]|uniref:Non-specific lipid-transfer protein n=1 Tax=Panicum miliaceum TaxID=4540 RepID=A0A3L6PAP0_PANMI|nr:non-specific lipid-transfer protein 1-like [Panicum miliaceum]